MHCILDTGPLLDFIVHRCEEASLVPWPDKRFRYCTLLTPIHRERFARFVHSGTYDFITSPGVLTEMHRRFVLAARVEPAWQIVQTELANTLVVES